MDSLSPWNNHPEASPCDSVAAEISNSLDLQVKSCKLTCFSEMPISSECHGLRESLGGRDVCEVDGYRHPSKYDWVHV